MQVTNLILSAFNLSFTKQSNIRKAWIAHSFELGEVAGRAHIVNAQRNGELDLVLRQLDAEAHKCPTDGIDFCSGIRHSFSNAWILSAYEMVRAADEQLRNLRSENKKVVALKKRLELVRMPLAKGEIKGDRGKNGNLKDLVLAHADGSNQRTYVNDGSYFLPIVFCSETGSIGWQPVDAERKENVYIRRIDLSNELLALFSQRTSPPREV